MPRSVLLLVNRDKPDAAAAAPEVVSLIKRKGRLVAELDADSSPLTPKQCRGADLIVVLGGDGTLMSQSRRCVALGLPMLGVNLGKLGFMAEFDLPVLRELADSLFDGSPLIVQDRPMLRCAVQDAAGKPIDPADPRDPAAVSRWLALNDAAVTAGPPFRMISLTIRIDGHSGPTVTGDGLIVCTPIGSTAYNVSAGGPIVAPDVSAMTITPIAAHTLSFRPVVVSGSATIELVMERVNETADDGPVGGTSLVLDGQVSSRLTIGQRVIIRRHNRAVGFVRNPRGSYWATLINKMRWAAPPLMR